MDLNAAAMFVSGGGGDDLVVGGSEEVKDQSRAFACPQPGSCGSRSRDDDPSLPDKRFAMQRVFVSSSSFKCLDLKMARINYPLDFLDHNER